MGDYESEGRYLLAFAPLAGWLAYAITTPPEVVFNLFIAVLAGLLLESAFREELPNRDTARFSWLVGGAATVVVLSTLTA